MSEIDVSARDAVANRAALRLLSNKLTEVIGYRSPASVRQSTVFTSFMQKLVGENMKKLTVLVALALLAVAGTGYAVVCAYDNVPGATLLIPYFRVSGNINAGGYIDYSGTDTDISFVNVSTPGIIAHVTVWNKYSKAVLDFNVPMTGKDVVTMSMRDVLNGNLNVNPAIQEGVDSKGNPLPDVCGVTIKTGSPTTYNATPYIGWGQQYYLRTAHPAGSGGTDPVTIDWQVSVSRYQSPDAFLPFRGAVLASLDESGDITSLQASDGANILDDNNPACAPDASKSDSYWISTLKGEFSGYVTIDVVNYCTNWFPDQDFYYTYDAIATAGWQVDNSYYYTPNCLIGDVFYIDQTANSGNISGDPAVALEFDSRLSTYISYETTDWWGTFYGRYLDFIPGSESNEWNQYIGYAGNHANDTTDTFAFAGDGREPLGDHYGSRYLADPANGLMTWLLIWRGDNNDGPSEGYTSNLCDWWAGTKSTGPGPQDYGFYDQAHILTFTTFDNDENTYTQSGGGPSGGGTQTFQDYVFLEANRIALNTGSTGNKQLIPGWSTTKFHGGWVDLLLRDPLYEESWNQAWVGVQHSGPGTLLNVGLAGTNLFNDFNCRDVVNFGFGGINFGVGGTYVGDNPPIP
jgi:hypothetical protein